MRNIEFDTSNKNTTHIIADCFEINADIISMRVNSKLPSFISKFIENRRRDRLIKIVKKLKKANAPLSRTNLIELFTYIFNNFSPDGEYKSIKGIKHIVIDESIESWVAMISVNDEFTAIIKIKMSDSGFSVELKIPDGNGFMTRDISDISFLLAGDIEIDQYLEKLNLTLISVMADYILDNLSMYKKSKGNII